MKHYGAPNKIGSYGWNRNYIRVLENVVGRYRDDTTKYVLSVFYKLRQNNLGRRSK